MREMKDSGIEWIGKIPIDWKAKKIKNIITIYEKSEIKAGDAKDEGNYPFYTSSQELIKKIDIALFEGNAITMATGGSASINYVDCEFSASTDCFNFTAHKFTKFLAYFLYCIKDGVINEIWFNGMGLKHLQKYDLLNSVVFFPEDVEINKITKFLDSKCSEIDSLHSDIEEEIETLKEYKKSVITEAVTKGLNPDVEMKDSGVEWIGKIPKEWNVNRLKNLFKFTKGLSITKENLIEEGLPVISYGQIHSKENTGIDVKQALLRFVSFDYLKNNPQCKVNQNDFVFADTSEDYDGCGNCVYKRDNSLLYGGYHAIILHSVKKEDNRYFAYLFLTDLWRKQVRELASGVKVLSITQKNLMNCSVIIPKYEEQQQISDHLDAKCSEIDSIIESKQQQLETLEQYKKSLIYEYVTGKKEVPANA